MNLSVKDHCQCERLGKGDFEVIAVHLEEVSLKSLSNGEIHRIYTKLCHVPHAMRFANNRRRIDRAQMIGRKVR